ncbi:hypothetical protein ACHAXR_007113 [Thalassiosira sp. AJA248-18]
MTTLHENLERKRRQNIIELKKSGVCHLCESSSGSRSYCRFIGNDDDADNQEGEAIEAAHAHAAAADPPLEEEVVPMRTCMCYGNSTSWPYPLKVCEMCIADDLTTGRVRSCGICGVVACDENCGVELVETTDRESWNNAGCLECRGMESFSEIELFRRRPHPNGIPRATRVCTNCLELFSLFSYGMKYHFTCRYFKCNNILVPSHIAELKRFMKPFPLSLLPEELLDSIVEFLGGKDLFSFGLSCTTIFRKAETVCKGLVMRFNHQLPTGPTRHVPAKRNSNKMMVHAEGKQKFGLRAPDDGKTWVSVLNQMEQLTRSIFYFDFQIKAGDDNAAQRYLRNRHKLVFDRVYSMPSGAGAVVTPYFDTTGLSLRGGQVLVTRYKWHHNSLEEREDRSIIFSTDKGLESVESGIHRVIIRYSCFCESESLGTIGILRRQGGSSVTWATQRDISCTGRMEEQVFGMEYDANRRVLTFYSKNQRTNKMENSTNIDNIVHEVANEGGGNLCFAAALAPGSIGIMGNQLSIRACNEDEWSAFLSHTVEKSIIPGIRGRGRRGEDRLMRFLDLRARRALAGPRAHDHDDDDMHARVEVEHMMDILMDDEMDSDFEDDMHVENAPAPNALPIVDARAGPIISISMSPTIEISFPSLSST